MKYVMKQKNILIWTSWCSELRSAVFFFVIIFKIFTIASRSCLEEHFKPSVLADMNNYGNCHWVVSALKYTDK